MEDKLMLAAQDVLAKRELCNLDIKFVLEKIRLVVSKEKKIRLKLEALEYKQFRRTMEHELLVKSVRQELRKVYGVFNLDDKKARENLLKDLQDDPSVENHERILSLHQSSSERLPYYKKIYSEIFKVVGKPSSILDLACGYNPLSYPLLGCTPKYLCADISNKDMEFLQQYFKEHGIDGHAMPLDLVLEYEKLPGLSSNVDVVFLFKALDSLEAIKRNISRQVLENIHSRFIVVSFATRSIGGNKDIRKERRSWFEKLLVRRGLKSEFFEVPGEAFYIIKNSR